MPVVRENRSDQLTGLPNRRSLADHLGHLLQGNSPHHLILIDLDRFKHFNVHNGHVAGDALLVRLGSHLTKLFPSGARAFRLGGDEFALVVQSDDPERGISVAERVRVFVADTLAMDQPDHCGDNDCLGPALMTCSIAVVPLKSHTLLADLLQDVDELLRQAKSDGGNTVRFRK